MQNISRLFLLLALLAPAAFAQRHIGEVTIDADNQKIPIRVSAATPELEALAIQAFSAHGRYRPVVSGADYDIRFAPAGGTQVRVDVTKTAKGAATPVAAEIVPGTSLRNALLRAADVAVAKTSGLGLRGFFSARLAFISEATGKREVYTSDLFCGEARRITNDRALALSPRWAPDGSRIIYTSFYKSGFPDIFQIDLGSYQRMTFVSFRGTNSSARFSPNGQQVAMILSGEGTPEIYFCDAHGRQVTRKTHSDAAKASPCFSPDGARLVFTMEPGPQLYVMSTGGGMPQRLVTGFRYAAEPDWSRTSPSKIACTVKDAGQYQIAVYDFSKGSAEVVSKALFDAIEPSWLADGRHVVYTARDRTNQCVLAILDTETGQSRRISPASLGSVTQASVWTP